MISEKKSQPTSHMEQHIFDLMRDFLKTDEAKQAGFKSQSRFVSEAVRQLMDKHKKRRFEHFNFADNLIRLIDNEKPRGTPFIEIYLKRGVLYCTDCESHNCVHILASWNIDTIRKELKNKGLSQPQ